MATPLETLRANINARTAGLTQSNDRRRSEISALSEGTDSALARLRKSQAERGASYGNTTQLLSSLAPVSAGAAFGAGVFGALEDFSEARGRRVEDAQVALQEARALRTAGAEEIKFNASLDKSEIDAQNTQDQLAIAQINVEDGRDFTRELQDARIDANEAAATRARTFQIKDRVLDAQIDELNQNAQFTVNEKARNNQVGKVSNSILALDTVSSDIDEQMEASDKAIERLQQALTGGIVLSPQNVAQLASAAESVNKAVGRHLGDLESDDGFLDNASNFLQGQSKSSVLEFRQSQIDKINDILQNYSAVNPDYVAPINTAAVRARRLEQEVPQ